MVSLVAELRGHERQAAEELGRWKTGVEKRKSVRRIAGGALNQLRAIVSPPKYSLPMSRLPTGGPRMDGVIGWSRIPGAAIAGGMRISRQESAAGGNPRFEFRGNLAGEHRS